MKSAKTVNQFLIAAAYIRVSTEEQLEFSPESQLKKIQEYAGQRQILLPDDLIFIDEGISGRSVQNRPAFLRMIQEARKTPRKFDLILVWKFSRFARNRQDSILYKSMLRKEYGIDVCSVTEQLSDDPTSILIEALLEAMDEYYSINLAQEVRRGMNEKFSRGGVVSPPPFGYQMGNGVYEPKEPEAFWIQSIFSDFLSGMSLRQIAQKLNDLGILTRRGNAFEPRSVRYILKNPVYTGKQQRRTDGVHLCTVSSAHAPLIPEEVFQAVQEKLALLDRSGTGALSAHPADFMLKGLIRCSCCGSTLTLARRTQSLQCCRYARGLCPQSHSVSLHLLNHLVLEQVEKDLSSDRLLHILSASRWPIPDPQTADSLILAEKKKLSRCREAYQSGADTLTEYQAESRKIKNRIRILSQSSKKDRSAPPVPEKTISLSSLFSLLRTDRIPENAKNTLLRSFISSVTFFRKENQIRIVYRLPISTASS